jgi:hypothetical protein
MPRRRKKLQERKRERERESKAAARTRRFRWPVSPLRDEDENAEGRHQQSLMANVDVTTAFQ